MFKYKEGDRVDRGVDPISPRAIVHTGTVVGSFTHPNGQRFYYIKWDGSIAAHSDGHYSAALVESRWRQVK